LEVLGRDHSASDGVMLLKSAIKIFGSDAVSVDLLFRKPGDTLQSWKDELIQILTFKPHHISLYELTPERGTPLFRQVSSHMKLILIYFFTYCIFKNFQLQLGEVVLPNENDTASMYILALELLKENGFERYEISNFAKAGSCAQSSHNMSYWNGTQYIGIGPGAHSRFFPLGSSLRESRVQTLDPKSWQDLVKRNGHATRLCRQQSQIDVLSELLATSLRTAKGIQPDR
jgi:coproporphyrinogen III oxidase-like Fe-S oxidoreductase